jgi:hypothetical protein
VGSGYQASCGQLLLGLRLRALLLLLVVLVPKMLLVAVLQLELQLQAAVGFGHCPPAWPVHANTQVKHCSLATC